MLKGCITAIVTPFKNNEVDYNALDKFLDFQLEQGIKAFVVNGTTAEATTLSLEEKRQIVEYIIKKVGKKVTLVVGASSNDTAKMVKEIKNVEDLDFDYLLLSSPYYNKTSQKGLVAHFNEALKVTKKKIILYNIPGRTGMQFDISTLVELSKNKQIVGIKEASGNIDYAQELFDILGDRLDVYCGNDDLSYVYGALGAKGVISACGNIYGFKYNQMFDFIENNDYKKANEINLQTLKLSKLLFNEVNPILIKALLSKLDILENELRLPLLADESVLIDTIYTEYKKII